MNPSPSAPEQIFRGNLAILKDQLAGIAGAQAQLVFFLARPESLRSLLDDESREPVGSFAFIRNGDDHRYICEAPIGDECLVAVQDIPVALLCCGCTRIARVGTRTGLRQRPSCQPFAARQPRNIFAFLRFAARQENMICPQRIVSGDNDAHRPIHGGQFFNREHIIDIAETGSAIFRRKDHAQQPHRAQLLHGRGRKLAGLVPGHDVGRNLARRKLANLPSQMLLLLVQHEGVQVFDRSTRDVHV